MSTDAFDRAGTLLAQSAWKGQSDPLSNEDIALIQQAQAAIRGYLVLILGAPASPEKLPCVQKLMRYMPIPDHTLEEVAIFALAQLQLMLTDLLRGTQHAGEANINAAKLCNSLSHFQ